MISLLAFLFLALIVSLVVHAWSNGIEEMSKLTPEELEAERKKWLNCGNPEQMLKSRRGDAGKWYTAIALCFLAVSAHAHPVGAVTETESVMDYIVGILGPLILFLCLAGAWNWFVGKMLGNYSVKPGKKWWFWGLLPLLFCASLAHASTMNPTSEPYPTDTQFAFMAVGGAQALAMDVTIMEGIAPWHPVWGKWYVRIPLETVTSFFWWRLVQSESGAVHTVENDNNRATCAAVGALVTSSVLCVESWNFGLGGCK